MKNEKLPLAIAVACGAASVALFMFKVSLPANILAVTAIVAFVFFAEAKWHNIKQAEIEGLKEALRQCQLKAPGEEPEGGGRKED
jgi:hypothetical protein